MKDRANTTNENNAPYKTLNLRTDLNSASTFNYKKNYRDSMSTRGGLSFVGSSGINDDPPFLVLPD